MILVLMAALAQAPVQAAGDAERGRSLYMANCMACHGRQADGKGPAAAALDPKPTDFTSAAWWKGRDDASVQASIRTGSPGTSMMGFAQLSPADLDDLVSWLRAQAPASAP